MASIGQLLRRYQTEGVLKEEHPLHAAAGLWGPLMVTNMLRGATTDAVLPTIDLPTHVAHFLNGRMGQNIGA